MLNLRGLRRKAALLLVLLHPTGMALAGPPDGAGSYADLVALFDEFRAWREVSADFGMGVDAALVAVERRGELKDFQARAQRLNVAGWERAQQVDFLAVRAQLDQHDFLLNVSRPWSRDPGIYVDRMLKVTFTGLPVSGEDLATLREQLVAVPRLIASARRNLTEIAADYADLALHNLSLADGVGHGYPFRADPPAGVIGWYADFLARAGAQQPELQAEIRAALLAVESFRDWLASRHPGLRAPAGVGKAAFDWYLRQVKLMPWTAEDLVGLGLRELDRLTAELALERHRNRDLPELEPAASAEEYRRRIAQTDTHIRQFVAETGFIAIPEFVGELATNVPWIERPGGRNFWEEIQYRDPHPDHLHAVIPGHRFDAALAARNTHPVRAHIADGARVEGWATYLETAALHAGMFRQLPRVRELIQIFGIFRAARVPADVWLQSNEMTVGDAVEFWIARVPFLDANVARVDAEIYLRRPPGYGLGYTVGMMQMQRLLADRKRQTGDAFDLARFHERLLAAGRLPISLVRWEMTGLDDEVRAFWDHRPLAETGLVQAAPPARDGSENERVRDRGAGKDQWWDALPRAAWGNMRRIELEADQGWFEVYDVAPGVFAIYEPGQFEEVISWLITGDEAALLFDTGLGIGDIRRVTDALTDLPLSVLNSHTHYDHIGGNHGFARVLATATEYTRRRAGGLAHDEVAGGVAEGWIWKPTPPGFVAERYRIEPFEISAAVTDGQRIELGGRTLEVLLTPGHAPDSLCLLDRDNRLLFTGDTFYPAPLYTHLDGSDFAAYARTARRLAGLAGEVDLLLPGHNEPAVESVYLERMAAAFAAIESGAAGFVITDGHREYAFDGFSVIVAAPVARAQGQTGR